MPSYENLQSNEYEAAMLRSELNELFQAQTEQLVISQPYDWDQPAEVILAGTHLAPDDSGQRAGLQIRQRIHNNQVNYLVISQEGSGYYWCLISETEAVTVWAARPAMDFDDLVAIRWRIRPEVAIWDKAFAEHLKGQPSPYALARRRIG